jgi:hypothetical protein
MKNNFNDSFEVELTIYNSSDMGLFNGYLMPCERNTILVNNIEKQISMSQSIYLKVDEHDKLFDKKFMEIDSLDVVFDFSHYIYNDFSNVIGRNIYKMINGLLTYENIGLYKLTFKSSGRLEAIFEKTNIKC